MSAPRPTPVPRLLADLPIHPVDGDLSAVSAVAVTGVALNSRDVLPGDLFAALPGANTHGAAHAVDAVNAGAAAILTDVAGAEALARTMADAAVPVIATADPRHALGPIASAIYGHPAARLKTVGVTGTNGKTTVTFLIESALRSVGMRTGLIGTTGTHIDADAVPTARTTPESPELHALLAVMVQRGVQAVALEVSSHSLVLGRVDGLVVDVACFTNLSVDHLDFHGDMESYFRAKASLFTPERARSAVVCIDDEWGRRLAAECALPLTTYGSAADAQWQLVSTTPIGGPAGRGSRQRLEVLTPSGTRTFVVGLPGQFNALNAIAAAVCVQRMGIDVPESAFIDVAVPGRMETIRGDHAFLVVVDYAHSPDAVARVLDVLRSQTDGRVIAVLGCGGDRDRDKRPTMGECAARGADLLIVTDDNPRGEEPATIRAAMLSGIPIERRSHIIEIPDRAEAIRHAIRQAQPGDTVAILGKGHETGQEINGVIHPFDDREMARRAISEVAA